MIISTRQYSNDGWKKEADSMFHDVGDRVPRCYCADRLAADVRQATLQSIAVQFRLDPAITKVVAITICRWKVAVYGLQEY